MQTLVQVVCTRGPSLRERIVKDPRGLGRSRLSVTRQKRPGRQHGWAKIHSSEPGLHGVLNVEWDADTSILVCRVVTKGRGRPDVIIGDFVEYLLRRCRSRIQAVNIVPR